MKNIIIIRHGESLGQTASQRGISRKDPQLEDCFLSRKGISEASQLQITLSDPSFMKEKMSMSEPIELVCTSPLTRALATTILGLGHIKLDKESKNGTDDGKLVDTPFICHPDLAEIGSIPENRGRPLKQVCQDLQSQLQPHNYDADIARVIGSIDFSLVPPSWPDVDKSQVHATAGTFLDWLHRRPETNIAVVCHFNVIRKLLRGAIRDVPNAWPIACVSHDGDTESLHLSPDDTDLKGSHKRVPRKGR